MDEIPDPEQSVDHMARWNDYAAETYQMATRAKVDDDYRASLALELQPEDKHSGPDVALLRACARKVIPDVYKWSITEAMGRRCYVTFQGLVEETST